MVKKVYGVGVGVGDKKLLTLKALEVLKKVDKIFVPISKEGKKSIAYEIIKDYVNDKEVEELLFPMIKDKEKLKKYWETALEKVLKEDGEVAIITIGDPTLYSTFSYVWKLLKENGVELDYFTIKGKGIKGYLSNIIPLRKVIKEGNYDIIHSHYSLTSFVASISKIGLKKYLILTRWL